jgi:hypothetical protein
MDTITGPRVIIRTHMESDNYRSKGAFLPLDYIERIELDAHRYRKLKEYLQGAPFYIEMLAVSPRFDADVDALPESK